jgi:hypothetical protein
MLRAAESRLTASQRRNSLLYLRQGAPPPSLSAGSDLGAPHAGVGKVRAGPGAKGQVTEILSLDSSTTPQEMPRRGRPERPIYPSANQAAVEDFTI